MLVHARAQESRIPKRILVRAFLEITDDFGFGKRSWQFQRIAQPEFFRNGFEQLVDRFCANRGQHFLPLGGTLPKGAHQAEASLPFAAMYPSYDALSIYLSRSAGFDNLIFTSQTASCGS